MRYRAFVLNEKNKSGLGKKTRLQNSLADDKLDSKTISKSNSCLNDKLNCNPISKTKFLVSRFDNNLNDKMIKDELRNNFNFKKKSNNHIIINCNDNVSYGKIFS